MASRQRCRGLVLVVLALVMAMACETHAVAPLVEVYLKFIDAGPYFQPITEIDAGEDFGMQVWVNGPDEGLASGYIDLSVIGTGTGFGVNSSTLNTAFLTTNTDGSYQTSPPLFDDYGGETSIAKFCGDDPAWPNGNWWFNASCTANSTPGGTLVFTPSQGKANFQIYGGGGEILPTEVSWNAGSLDVVPEPISISLFALSGLVFLRRRKGVS